MMTAVPSRGNHWSLTLTQCFPLVNKSDAQKLNGHNYGG
jgi:hypothetical protein